MFTRRRRATTAAPVDSHAPVPNARSGWALTHVVNHITIAGDRLVAWYLADPQMWSFRSVADGESLIEAGAAQLAELVGSTVYGRVTTRPYPVSSWASASWRNSPDPGPIADAGVGGRYWPILERDQRHLASRTAWAEKLVYIGVDLGRASSVGRIVQKVWTGVVDRELAALEAREAEISRIMGGAGIEASPVTPAEMAWLLSRSFGLGLPAPDEGVQDPPSAWDTGALAEFTSTVEWTALPLAQSTSVRGLVGSELISRHVVVLTVGRMGDIAIPEKHEPWVAMSDRLPFPVEWSWRVDIRKPEDTAREMVRLADRVSAQIDHYSEHDKQPPRQLARQMQRAAEVEDEMRSGFDGLSTRTRGWWRVAVSGATEKEALARANQVVDLYKPEIQLVRELDQWRLAREFVPGEPLANTGHVRHLPVLKVAAGVPAATAEIGDRRGVHIGETVGFASRAVIWDPWYSPEVVEGSGLVPLVGGLGSGKSVLMSGIIYKTCAAGVPWYALDPSGMLAPLADVPELRGLGRSIDVLRSGPGALNPYALVPTPDRSWFDSESEWRLAVDAAPATRRDLAFDALRWCLPPQMARDERALDLLRDAITASPADERSSTVHVLSWLAMRRDEEVGRRLHARLCEARERELSRLFFAAPGQVGSISDEASARLTIFGLKGLVWPDESKPRDEWSVEEGLTRPIVNLAAWATLRSVYRRPRHDRKGVALDEAHEITRVSTGQTLVQKIATDSRKHNLAALVASQNASAVLGQNINNFVGAAFVGRTQDEDAQADACRLLGLPTGAGYEPILGSLSRARRRRSEEGRGDRTPREFIFRDGLGGLGERGGIERIRVDLSAHPDFLAAVDSTPSERAARMRRQGQAPEVVDHDDEFEDEDEDDDPRGGSVDLTEAEARAADIVRTQPTDAVRTQPADAVRVEPADAVRVGSGVDVRDGGPLTQRADLGWPRSGGGVPSLDGVA